MSKYHELKSYLPDVFSNISDVEVFLQAFGMQMDDVDTDTFQVRDNNFVPFADENTVKQWENFLFIPVNADRTMDDRKSLIMSFFTGRGKLSATDIKAVIALFTESPVTVTFENSTVTIEIHRVVTDTFLLDDFYWILRKKMPAHLGLVINSITNYDIEETVTLIPSMVPTVEVTMPEIIPDVDFDKLIPIAPAMQPILEIVLDEIQEENHLVANATLTGASVLITEHDLDEILDVPDLDTMVTAKGAGVLVTDHILEEIIPVVNWTTEVQQQTSLFVISETTLGDADQLEFNWEAIGYINSTLQTSTDMSLEEIKEEN